jgi:glyoxylase-like metal-dependent hydrolase (beta-lactamase superfamily II)/rhodanese-related sulfurtransferase
MIFKPYYLGCLAHASYLVGDERTMSAVIVDPQRDVGGYIADAAEAGLTIRHVILTHFHADFVAGHLELAAATGASIHLGAQARAEYPFHPLHDGEGIELGSVRLVALETPGHTPESITVLVYDLEKDGEKPQIALTGDTLFVGDVGRPDLMASAGTSASDLAGMMYDTIHGKLAALPDEVQVWPAHGAGSMCGKNLSKERSSTIGAQKKSNWAFRAMSKAEFAREATTDLPLQPAYFGHAADLNRRKRPTLGMVLERELVGVPLERILRALADGDTVLDAREPDDFARGHLAGSINIGLSGQYASWSGVLLDRDRRIWLVAAPGKETEAAMRLGRIGFDLVAGFLEGGPAAFASKPDRVRTFRRRTVDELASEIASKSPPHVLDVRAPSEWNDKHIAGAQHVPLGELEKRVAEVPRGKRIVVHCGGGYRSSIAASLLMKHGRTEIEDLIGGFAAWVAAGKPTTR